MPYISVGEIVKDKLANDVGWFQGLYTEEEYANGVFAPDDLIIRLLVEKIKENQQNCILDGFPRNWEQCKIFLSEFEKQYFLVDISQDEDILLERVLQRRICPSCNKIYALSNPNMLPNIDDTCIVCGVKVIQRPDDNYETAKNRIDKYLTCYHQYADWLIGGAYAGINIHPKNSYNVDLIVGIIESFVKLYETHPFKYIVENFEYDK